MLPARISSLLAAALVAACTSMAATAFVSREMQRCSMTSVHLKRTSPMTKLPPSPSISSRQLQLLASSTNDHDADESVEQPRSKPSRTTDLKELASQIDAKPSPDSAAPAESTSRPRYQLGVGKNLPLSDGADAAAAAPSEDAAALNWNVPPPLKGKFVRPKPTKQKYDMGLGKNAPLGPNDEIKARIEEGVDYTGQSDTMRTTQRLLPKGDEESARLTRAVWDEGHFDDSGSNSVAKTVGSGMPEDVSLRGSALAGAAVDTQQPDIIDYQQIDLSIPPSVYSLDAARPIDAVWELMRHEAQLEAAREPLLVSFLYSTILNHPTLESALSFHLANRLSSPAMLSTQIMSLIREALDGDVDFRRKLRADMLAVRDRDPACNCLPDVFLYFKGFHALQTYRVAHYLWRSGRRVLAHYLQSQMSQHFQIDIHPNATLGSGIMLDHGTGIVIGETAHLGHNCSVLHHVTLGGSGKKGVDRHPKVGNGVLLGAGASVLGNINIGDGCQVGAGTLVIEDLPPRSVAVGVPAKIIGRFVDVTAQPSIGMNQLGSKEAEESIFMYGMDGI